MFLAKKKKKSSVSTPIHVKPEAITIWDSKNTREVPDLKKPKI